MICFALLMILDRPAAVPAATWEFMPGRRLFRPLLADPGEARFGIYTYLDDDKLEGDIGGSWEAFNAAFDDPQRTQLRIGIHSGVYTLLRKTGRTFPLDTADFIFGLHTDVKRGNLTGRFSFAHISAHQADGFNDPERKPFTYSREFFTLYGSYDRSRLRLYAGLRLSNHAIPDIKRWRIQFGGEMTSKPLIGRNGRAYAAYDLRIYDDAGAVANQTGQAGIMFHNENHAGFRLAFIGHTGRSEHGQFHDRTDRFVALGVFFDM